MIKTKQNPLCNGRLRTKRNGELLLDSARIIVSSTDPVKLITAQIQYCRLVEKMARQNARVK